MHLSRNHRFLLLLLSGALYLLFPQLTRAEQTVPVPVQALVDPQAKRPTAPPTTPPLDPANVSRAPATTGSPLVVEPEAAPTRKTLPLPKILEIFKKRKEKLRDEAARLQLLLEQARFFGMLYATDDKAVPIIEKSDFDKIDFAAWLGTNDDATTPFFPLRTKPAPSVDQLHYLEQAGEILSKVHESGKAGATVSLAYAWVLSHQGKQREARAILKPYFADKHSLERSLANLKPGARFFIPLEPGAKWLRVRNGSQLLWEAQIFPSLIQETASNLFLRNEEGAFVRVNLSKEAKTYASKPTPAAFQSLFLRVKSALNKREEVLFQESTQTSLLSPAKIFSQLQSLHKAHDNYSAPQTLERLANAKTPEDCATLPGSAEFTEGSFPLSLVCVTERAWKEKNFSFCLDGAYSTKHKLHFSDRQLYPCLHYLAYRVRNKEFCQDIAKSFQERKLDLPLGGCEEVAAHSSDMLKKIGAASAFKETAPSAFYSDTDRDLTRLRLSHGTLEVSLQATSAGKAEVGQLAWHVQPGFSTGGRLEKTVMETGHLTEGANKLALQVAVEDDAGKILSSENVELLMPDAERVSNARPKTLTIDELVTKTANGYAAALYASSLDPVADKNTVESLKDLLWLEANQLATVPAAPKVAKIAVVPPPPVPEPAPAVVPVPAPPPATAAAAQPVAAAIPPPVASEPAKPVPPTTSPEQMQRAPAAATPTEPALAPPPAPTVTAAPAPAAPTPSPAVPVP